MPWSEVSVMDLRLEFVMLAEQPGSNVSALCRRFGISRKTGYKWLGRAGSGAALSDRSRRPRSNPRRTPEGMEAAVLAVRSDHPCWGGRKIARRLVDLGETDVPAPSTVTAILQHHGVALGQAGTPAAFQRFERSRPNELWQMDFKGHFALAQGRCHPLTVLDDCSRFNLCLAACGNEQGETVQGASAGSIPSLWPAGVDHRRQRLALGRWTEHAVHAARRLVSAPRHRPQSQPSLSSSDAGQGRALPPHAESRTPGRSAFRRSRALPAGLRPLAHRLQLRAAPSGPRLGRAGCPIPTQSASLPRGPAAHRVRARTSGPPRPGQRPHQLQRQDLQTAQGVRRIPGRTGANHPRRNMEGDLRKPPDRATRHARWHSQNCYPCLRTL